MRTLLIAVLSIITCANFAQVPDSELLKIGEYTATGKMFEAYAYVSKDTSTIFLYRLESTIVYPQNFESDYKPKVYISCTTTMMDDLTKICSCYKEWAKTAKDNKVGKMQKVIELDAPVSLYSLHREAKGYPKFKEFKQTKFTFNIPAVDKTPTLFINDTFVEDRTQIPVIIGLAFGSPEEFEAFINFLDPKKVLKRIKEGKTSLFSQDTPNEKRESTIPVVVDNTPVQQDAPKAVRPICKQRKGQIAKEALGRWKSAARSVKVTK